MSERIYLDHAATTPVDPVVMAAMQPYLTAQFFNPSAQYLAARAVRKDVETARATIARWLGARPSEIIFTAGGTEANNIAIRGVMDQYPEGNMVVSAIEHDAVLKPAADYEVRVAPVRSDGRVDARALADLIDDRTVLVSVMYANNEIGTVEPLKEIAGVIAERRRGRLGGMPLYFHTDACQAGAYLDLHAARHGVDMMTINASKIYGPKQVGALYIKAGVDLRPFMKGGGQERQLRSGTENVAGIMGFVAALSLVQGRRQEEVNRLQKLQKLAIEVLGSAPLNAIVNGSQKYRLPNNIHVTFPGQDNERLMMELDERGIMVAVGSACSASSEEPSHVLAAVGVSEQDARSSLRISMGRTTTESDIRRLAQELRAIMGR